MEVTKKCNTCKEAKELSEFGKVPANKDGLRGQCKICRATYNREHKENNKDKYTALPDGYNKKYYQANKEAYTDKAREYYKDNKESMSTYHKIYNQTPNGRASALKRGAKRKAAKRGATVNLNAEEQMRVSAIYKEASEINFLAGYVVVHVDHIYPISLGGAHSPINLQILLAKTNLEKYNKLPEEGLGQTVEEYYYKEEVA